MRIFIPVVLLIFQICAIGYARFVPTRYFCWAPFDMQTVYDARAQVNGHDLTPQEFLHRYRRPVHGGDNRSPQHVIDMLAQTEAKHARQGDHATIELKYRVNGKEPLEWHWPETPQNP
jgi:hypothetical protein